MSRRQCRSSGEGDRSCLGDCAIQWRIQREVRPKHPDIEVESDGRTRADVVPALVDKALGSARAGTKRKATDLCLMYVEVENGGDGVIVRTVIRGLSLSSAHHSRATCKSV